MSTSNLPEPTRRRLPARISAGRRAGWPWTLAIVAGTLLAGLVTCAPAPGPAATTTHGTGDLGPSALSFAYADLAAHQVPAGLRSAEVRSTAATPTAGPSVTLTYDAADDAVLAIAPNETVNSTGTYVWGPTVDTWEFADGNWSQLAVPVSPPNRAWATMTYDPSDGYVVLFGGMSLHTVGAYGESYPLNDTWTFAHGAWTNRTVAGAPPSRGYAHLVWDTADGYAYLYGGFGRHGNLSDSWSYRGGNWTEITTGPTPPSEGSMAYDVADGYVLYFGGAYAAPGAGTAAETWTYRAGTWSNITATVGAAPAARTEAGMAYDSTAGVVVLFGGCCAPVQPYVSHWVMLGDLWTYSHAAWTLVNSSTPMGTREQPQMADDPAANGTFLYGGWGGNLSYDDSWILQPSSSGVTPAALEIGPALILSASRLTLGAVLSIRTVGALAGYGAAYRYLGLPPGCASADAPDLTCAPTAAGTYEVSVNVSSAELGQSIAHGIVQIVPSGSRSSGGAGGGGSPGSGWATFATGLVVGGALAAGLGVAWLFRERRRARERRAVIAQLTATEGSLDWENDRRREPPCD